MLIGAHSGVIESITPDMVNGAIEFIGSLFTWQNTIRVIVDKGYAGVYLPAIVFFMSWGMWNLYYYPALGQWFSFAGGLSLVLANLVWVAAMLRYGRKG